MSSDQALVTVEVLEHLREEFGAENTTRLVEVFIADTTRRVGDLVAAWRREDFHAVAAEAHALHAGAAGLGAARLATDLREAEGSAKAENREQLSRVMSRMEEVTATTTEALERFARRPGGTA